MSLRDWLAQILACESMPEALDLIVLESALELLEARAAENWRDFEDGAEVGAEAAELLREMSKVLSWLCADLDSFLDSFDFAWVRAAMAKAQCLLDLRDELNRLFCSHQAVLARSLVA